MNTKTGRKITVIDMNAVRREISAAHTRIRNWEKSLTETPTPHDHWTTLAGYAGPNLKNAMRAGIAHIEIPNDGRGKPRFALKED